MIIVECRQGSPEWHSARAGVITASMFSVARKRIGGLDERQQRYVDFVKAGMTEKAAAEQAGFKAAPRAEGIAKALAGENVGDWSDEAKKYAFRLAIERISGEPLDEGFETWQMRRGHDLEEPARIAHESKTGLLVDLAGFVLTDDRRFGASADGLIDADGGCEYKCLVAPDRIRDVLINDDISEFKDQVQGCLWITGRSWWHFCLYCPALAPIGKELYLQHVERDDDYIEALEQDLIAFERLVTEYETILRARKAA